eukprot:g1906.t1
MDTSDVDAVEIVSLTPHEVKYFLSKRKGVLSSAVDPQQAYTDNQARLKILLNTENKANHRFLQKCCKEGDTESAKKILNVIEQKSQSTNDVCFVHEMHRRDWFREHLFTAIRGNFPKLVQLVLKNGADADFPFSGTPPLCVAAEKGNVQICQMLLNAGADVDAQDGSGFTPLFLAVKNNRLPAMKMLLEAAADRDIPETHGGKTPLIHACSKGDDKTVDLLLKAIPEKGIPGASREHHEKHFGWTPLIFAARGGHVKITKRLINNHVDLENRDSHDGWTALFHSVKMHCNEVLQSLITSGANVDIVDNENRTPLMIAVQLGFNDTLNILLDSFVTSFDDDADEDDIQEAIKKLRKFVTRKDSDGNSALHIAVQHDNVDAVSAILEVGVKIDQYNLDKQRPIDIAERLGKHKIYKILKEHDNE